MAKILITEDEDGLRRFVARALQLDGHETVEAADGAEGLACLKGANFDLLLSDIRMPVMDGIELAHQASARISGVEDIVDDRLCRTARTGRQFDRQGHRCRVEAVYVAGYSQGCCGGAGGLSNSSSIFAGTHPLCHSVTSPPQGGRLAAGFLRP